MDRVFSTRLDEDLVRRVDRFVKSRSLSKKSVIEEALQEYLDRIEPDRDLLALGRSFGAWKRKGPPETTWRNARTAFNRGFRRHSTRP